MIISKEITPIRMALGTGDKRFTLDQIKRSLKKIVDTGKIEELDFIKEYGVLQGAAWPGIHPWEAEQNLVYPYSLVGYSRPGFGDTRGASEENYGRCSVHSCNQGIVHHFHMVDSNGVEFHVGSTCIMKHHHADSWLCEVVEAVVKNIRNKASRERARAKRAEKRAIRLAEQQERYDAWVARSEAINIRNAEKLAQAEPLLAQFLQGLKNLRSVRHQMGLGDGGISVLHNNLLYVDHTFTEEEKGWLVRSCTSYHANLQDISRDQEEARAKISVKVAEDLEKIINIYKS